MITVYGTLLTFLAAFFAAYGGWMIESRERLAVRPAGVIGYVLGAVVLAIGFCWQLHV